MAKGIRPARKLFFAVGLFLFSVITVNVTMSGASVSAVNCTPGRLWCNSDERRAYNDCYAPANPARHVQGSIWFNNTSNTPTDDGYYALGVYVSATQNSVNVNIRGSFYSCGSGNGMYSSIYAVNISPNSDGGRYPSSSRLSVSGSVLNRGSYVGQNYRWSTQGSSLAGTLNVSGLAMNNTNGTASQTITVGLYRCFSNNGSSATGTCNISPVPITIIREQRPPYTLTPSVTLNPSGSVEANQQLYATPAINSRGGGTANGITWQLTRFIAGPTASFPAAQQDNGTTPVAHYGNGAVSVAGSTRNFNTGVTTLPRFDDTSQDLPVGTRQCYALSVRPYTNTNNANQWRHGAARCVVVAKKPKVQVLGGDLIVGRGSASNPSRVSEVTTSVSRPSGGVSYGSWTEYGIVANGQVSGMSSGSGYVGGATTDVLCSVSLLTLTNGGDPTCDDANLGGYTHTSTSPNIAGRFPISATTPRITAASITITGDSLQGLYAVTPGALSIEGGGEIPAGQWVVINAPNTDVTITSDIRYTSADLGAIADVPQVVIIARNISIADSVQNIDAWLVATGTGADGTINTCGAGGVTTSTLPHAGQCGARLTINGPVSANHLLLRRTAGAGTGAASGDPAEVINLRADAYIWASGYSPGTGRLPTVKVTELPPRF